MCNKIKTIIFVFSRRGDPNFLINIKNLSTHFLLLGPWSSKLGTTLLIAFSCLVFEEDDERNKLHGNEVCASLQKLMHRAHCFNATRKKSFDLP